MVAPRSHRRTGAERRDCDRDGIRRLFSGNPLIKRHASDQLKPLFGERSVVVLEPAEHLERRKLLLPSFQGGSVRAYGDEIEKLTEAAIADWSSGQVVKILGCTVAHPRRHPPGTAGVRAVGAPGSRRVREIFDSMVGLPGSSIAGYFPRLVRRSRWNLPGERYWRLRDSLDAILIQQVEAARATPLSTQEHAILPLLIRSRDKNGHGLDDVDLRDELKALITAGHETTATAIAWAAELLAHNPAAQASAREAAMTGDSEYLDAFVKEVLRIRTPVPVSATRRLTEPFELGGYTIPPGVPILGERIRSSSRPCALSGAREVPGRPVHREIARRLRVPSVRRWRAALHRLGPRVTGDPNRTDDHPQDFRACANGGQARVDRPSRDHPRAGERGAGTAGGVTTNACRVRSGRLPCEFTAVSPLVADISCSQPPELAIRSGRDKRQRQ